MERTIVFCSLCGVEIGKKSSNTHNLMAGMDHGDYQQWPDTNGNIIDVCASCCQVIFKAKNFGIISYDEKPLMERAGFRWNGVMWYYTGKDH